MLAGSEVKATCSVHTELETTVTWIMDEETPSRKVTQDRNTSHVISHLAVPSEHWKTLKHVTCRAKHKCFQSKEKTVNVTGKRTVLHSNQLWSLKEIHEKSNVLVLIQVLCFQLHLWSSGDFCQMYRRQTVLCWRVTSQNFPPATFMSHFRPTSLTSLRNCLLSSRRPQTTIQSQDTSLSLRRTGRMGAVSHARCIKASPKAGSPTPLGVFLVSTVTVPPFNG